MRTKTKSIVASIGLALGWLLLCLTPRAEAQITASVNLTTNVVNSQATVLSAASPGAAAMLYVSTPSGALSCTIYPQVSFTLVRAMQPLPMGLIVTSAGAAWQAVPSQVALQPGDTVIGTLSVAGVGCSNELPLTLSMTYTLAAGLCYADPSACVTLGGVLAGPNGMNSGNYSLTFNPSQLAVLAGAPPPQPSGCTDQSTARQIKFNLLGTIGDSGTAPNTVIPVETIARPITFPPDFAGTVNDVPSTSVGTVAVNPTGAKTFTILVARGSYISGQCSNATASSVGTVAIGTDGSFTFATVGDAGLVLNPCDRVSVQVPSSSDATLSGVSFTLAGVGGL